MTLSVLDDPKTQHWIGAFPPDRVPTEEWVQQHVYWLWGFYLKDFQLDVVMSLLGGGLMSILMPTDFGKSTALKISVVLSLILQPKTPNIIVKISRTAAAQALTSIVFTLVKASEVYPYVKPKVRWNRSTGLPMTGHSFMIEGGDWNRTDNPSVYAASIWEADLQGRRGRAHIDDIETEREARYFLYRQRLEARVDSILRTIEDNVLFLFAFFGTPQHGESVYFKIVDRLRSLGSRFKVILLPWRNPDTGKLLWPERASKVEIHRRTMTPWAFAVAYDLRPAKVGRPDAIKIEEAKDKEFPFCRTRQVFEEWLRTKYDNANEMMALAHYYIGYDPSAEYEFAIGVVCYIAQEVFLLDAYMEPGDIIEQVSRVAEFYERYPDSIIVVERNAQQKAFRDVLYERLPDAQIEMHQTTDIKDDEKIGIPGLLQLLRYNCFHMPYGDERGELLSDYLVAELEVYGAMSHPHLLPALWFTFYWHRKYAVTAVIRKATKEPEPTFRILPVQLDRTRGAWARAGRR